MEFLRDAQAWQPYLATQAQVLLHQRLRHGDGRVWNPDAKIWNLILMPSPDRCLLAGKGAACLGAPLGSVTRSAFGYAVSSPGQLYPTSLQGISQ
jgi:hypothetical protein